MHQLFWFIYRSIQLDLQFLQINKGFFSKINFIYIKYLLLLVIPIKRIFNGKNEGKVTVSGRSYWYNDQYGISFLQSVYVDNAFLKKFIAKDGIIIDIGANIGQFNFFSGDYLQAKKIFSFEPTKEAFEFLRKNAKLVKHTAIGTSRKISLHIPNTTLMASKFAYTNKDIIERVPCIRLDDVDDIIKLPRIDLLKIDTEGSEFDVLLSSSQTLKKCLFVLVEASLHRNSSGDLMRICALMLKLNKNFIIETIGRSYMDDGKISAVDVLFKNTNLSN